MLDEDEDTNASFDDVVAEIELHEASELVMFDRSSVNGYVTFKFYGHDSELKAKLTFDYVDADMVQRAGAVLDHLSSARHDISQADVESIWEGWEHKQTARALSFAG